MSFDCALLTREDKIGCRGYLRVRSLTIIPQMASHLFKFVAMLVMVRRHLLIMVLITPEADLVLQFHRCEGIDVVSKSEV